ncbi:Abi-alpha family protein [Nocardioides sp. QY071]|uniref:Abi-alpha family protein n=1 Tax=Nocardioides sp. QY071 TaxID=3044187 RepID=UPI002499BCFE|nr:Abi-alpha family protein [Nocardioides sp. QY071]WGY01423.1 Abi-alpha family protein [Nocardioides sp. QY071]
MSRDGRDRLAARGRALLARSRDVAAPPDDHPAFARVLDQLAPDEARLLWFLHTSGPEPTVDVHLGGLAGRLAPAVLARGLSLVGARAGVRRPERLPLHLTNLRRLGLVADTDEPVADLTRYQVVEAQPAVLTAARTARRAHVVRRRLELTPFGRAFVHACLGSSCDTVT